MDIYEEFYLKVDLLSNQHLDVTSFANGVLKALSEASEKLAFSPTLFAPDEATPCPNCGDDLFRCPTCQEAHLQRLAGKT